MSDVAQLGLQVDSGPVKAATAALGQFSAASQTAQTATEKLITATGRSESQVRSIDSMAKRAGVSFQDMAAKVDATSAAHNKLVTASASASKGIQNLAQSSKGAANDNGSFQKSTEASNSSLEKLANTLTRRVLFAFVAKEIRDLAAYVWQLNGAVAATADAAQRSSIGSGNFQGLQTAAAYKGVSGTDFNASMIAFNQQVSLAKLGLGDLKTLLSSNGKAVSDTATTFGVVADLVKAVAGDTRTQFAILTQAGLPATAAYVKLMEQGSDAIKKQGDAAGKLTTQQEEEAKRIDAKWQEGWVNFENWGKRAVVNVMSGLSNVPDWFKKQADSLYALPKPNAQGDWLGVTAPKGAVTSAPLPPITPPKKVVNPEDEKALNSIYQQRISLLGPLASVEEIVAAKQKEINTAGLNHIHISGDQAAALLLITRAQTELTRVNAQAQIGVFDLAKAQQAANDNLKSLVAQKLLDPANAQQWAAAMQYSAKSVEQLSEQAKVAGAPLEQLQRLANEAGNVRTQLDQFATTSFNAVTPALRDMLLGTTSLSNGFKALGLTIVQALTDAIIKITIIKPLIDGLTSSLSGSGILGFLGISGGGSGAAAQASSAATLSGNTGGAFFGPGFASGGFTGLGGKYEPAGIVHRGEYVLDAATTSRIGVPRLNSLRGYADGGLVGGMTSGSNDNSAAQGVHVTVGVSVDNDGNLQAYVKNISQKTVSGFAASPAFVDHVAVASKKAKTRRIL